MSWWMNVSNLLAANTSLGCMLAGARSLRGNVYTTPYPIHCPHIGSQYAYMDDLWQLDRSPASVPRVWLRSQVLQPSPTPLLAPVWQAALRDYPDPRLRHFLVQGLQEGFRIGYNAPRGQLRPAKRNIPSSYEHPEVVDKYLANECKLGRVLGPWLTPPPCPIHISRFGVIPKKSQPGKWRLIVDLSFPEGASVNDGIPPSYCSLRYPSIDMGIEQILTAGQGAQLSKLDIKDAYRIVPVHSDDWPMLGMQWKGQYYMDTRLPFGLRSAPKLFTALADAAQWLIRTRGVTCCLHYLDDYFFVEPPHTPAKALAIATNTLAELGIPLAPDKVEGPTTRLSFLGIELDTIAMTASLPKHKLQRLQDMLVTWHDRKACTKRELLSLVGVLQHATMVVRFGRAFLRRMIELAKATREYHHMVRLNRDFRSDVQWWRLFLPRWNGTSFLYPGITATPNITVYSDASGSWGYGAWCEPEMHWFQGAWPPWWQDRSITAKELLPIVLAAAVWGPQWRGRVIRYRCDNAAIVHVIHTSRSTEPLVMQLLRGLHLFAMEHAFYFSAMHIAGTDNGPADSLSRNHAALFRSQVPQASPIPDTLHPTLMQLFLAEHPPDWLSNSWRQQLTTILGKVLQNPHNAPTTPVSSNT